MREIKFRVWDKGRMVEAFKEIEKMRQELRHYSFEIGV